MGQWLAWSYVVMPYVFLLAVALMITSAILRWVFILRVASADLDHANGYRTEKMLLWKTHACNEVSAFVIFVGFIARGVQLTGTMSEGIGLFITVIAILYGFFDWKKTHYLYRLYNYQRANGTHQ